MRPYFRGNSRVGYLARALEEGVGGRRLRLLAAPHQPGHRRPDGLGRLLSYTQTSGVGFNFRRGLQSRLSPHGLYPSSDVVNLKKRSAGERDSELGEGHLRLHMYISKQQYRVHKQRYNHPANLFSQLIYLLFAIPVYYKVAEAIAWGLEHRAPGGY